MRLRLTRTLAMRAFVIASLLLAAWPVRAQMTREEIALRNQIYELQQQVQALQQQMASQGGGGGSYLGRQAYPPPQGSPSNDIVAQLLARVQTLEEQVRSLRGNVDEAQNQLQRQGADLGKRIDDLAFQMQNGQAGAGAPATAAPPVPGGAGAPMAPPSPLTLSPPPGNLGSVPMGAPGSPQTQFAPPGAAPGQPPAAPVRRTPELAIQEGNAALARRDYPAAEAAAREVLNNYRTSPRAYDAQYLLAQSLAGEKQYSQAAIAYDDTYNRSRKGARAPEALVGLANALTAINEKRAACDTLGKLRSEFPQMRAEIRDAAASVQQRAACK